MLTRVLNFALLAAMLSGFQFHAQAQVTDDEDSTEVVPAAQDSTMLLPPPVSDQAYPSQVGAERRANYIRLGALFSAAYIDNMYAGSGAAAISEKIYSVRPTVAFDRTSTRQHITVTYTPGFTFYQPTSDLNETDQNAIVSYNRRMTPRATLNASDVFQKTSTSFSSVFSAPGGAVSGSGSTATQGIIAPFAPRLTNTANGNLSLQFSPRGMVGVSGSQLKLHYPDVAQAPDLYDSDEWGGGAYYSHRITGSHYIGTTYRYARILAYPKNAQSETQTHTIYLFYTLYLKPNFSLSVSGGPQYFNASQAFPSTSSQQSGGAPASIPAATSWSPAVTASMGLQERHTSFAASYSRSVTAGGGLLGTFNSNTVNASGRWQMARTWIGGATASYSTVKTVNLLLVSSTAGGHSIAGTVSLEHPLSSSLRMSFQYDHLHQSYSGIVAATSDPDSNREMISISWEFARPLGR
jgi:hypothetical protein